MNDQYTDTGLLFLYYYNNIMVYVIIIILNYYLTFEVKANARWDLSLSDCCCIYGLHTPLLLTLLLGDKISEAGLGADVLSLLQQLPLPI